MVIEKPLKNILDQHKASVIRERAVEKEAVIGIYSQSVYNSRVAWMRWRRKAICFGLCF